MRLPWGFFIQRFFLRPKPNTIAVIRKEESSLLTVDSQIETNIEISYKSNPLNLLYKTAFVIRNEGKETISDISCTIDFEEQEVNNNILEFFAEDSTGKILQSSDVNINLTNKRVNLSINFLNSFRDYKDKISLIIYSIEPLSVKDATGRGRGWGVQYKDYWNLSQRTEKIDKIMSFWGTGISFIFVFLGMVAIIAIISLK